MGYRSDVYMCIKGPANRMLGEIASLLLAGDKVMHDALKEWNVVAVEGSTEAVMVLGGEGVDWKWYDSYPDVQAHTAVYFHFKSLHENLEFSGTFVRSGEESGDLEQTHFGDGYDLGCIVQGIERSYNGQGADLRPSIAAQQQAEEAVHNLTSLDDMKKTL